MPTTTYTVTRICGDCPRDYSRTVVEINDERKHIRIGCDGCKSSVEIKVPSRGSWAHEKNDAGTLFVSMWKHYV